jgi:hypothetical protein
MNLNDRDGPDGDLRGDVKFDTRVSRVVCPSNLPIPSFTSTFVGLTLFCLLSGGSSSDTQLEEPFAWPGAFVVSFFPKQRI